MVTQCSSACALTCASACLQYDKVDYEMRPTEVEVIYYELEDYEETVTMSELQEVDEEVEARPFSIGSL